MTDDLSSDGMAYDLIVESALRGVVRAVLVQAAEDGIPTPHHFYITFRTRHPGVMIPQHLYADHPDEMTIVLQHQFWDLTITDDSFAVTLSFNNVSHTVTVPFAAVTAFADPSVKFGLQFGVDEELERPLDHITSPAPTASLPAPAASEATDDIPPAEDGPKVVSLDAFRKK